MAKAYDRMSWNFLIIVMRKFGCSEGWLDIIWRLISDVWYSIIINGTRKGFFTSTQGVKLGDPLSPSLFIIGSEVLTRLLNKLNHNENFTPFTRDMNGPIINHLAYVDDILIFSGGNNKSIKLIQKQVRRYEKASGQKVNKDKSFFITAPNTSPGRINRMGQASSYMDKNFPFNYLGCLIFTGRKKISHFDAMNPSKEIFYLMEKYFANFLWGSSEGKNKYKGVSWSKLCLPKDEGGVGIRIMEDISDTLSSKRWWNQVKLNSVVSNQTTQFITDISIGNKSKPDFPIWNASNDVFKKWWDKKSSNVVHKTMLQITPLMICWELWKQSLESLNQWPIICDTVERLKPLQSWRQVVWNKLQEGCVQVNTDGSFLKDNDIAGICGIVRDNNGDFIMAFSISIKFKSNNMAEAMATEFGVKWCNQQGYTNFTLELDSMVIANMLQDRHYTNLKLKQVIDNILGIKEKTGMHVTHCYREDNQVADCLAKLASLTGHELIINSYHQLPRNAKEAFQLDKIQMPSIRTKYDKANFHFS
ncbi:uncharacterized protein [Nicotiana tomentosiformis]|uniref:uncharacterized protein n=1 Tax=Nicotiana tomentosiformis TaxID=4098 RepID=UPI00388C5EC3